MTQAPRLLALDLDGTLLRRDKTIAPVDRDAIRACIKAGVHVAICTGRITLGALPSARELSLTTPMICADGGALCPKVVSRSTDTMRSPPVTSRVIPLGDP